MSVHAFVIESPGHRMVVDTCIGNDKRRAFPGWNMLQLPFLADLEKAGFARDSIDRVLCTHLHVDHVGWNTMLVDDKWTPTFPRARYLIGRFTLTLSASRRFARDCCAPCAGMGFCASMIIRGLHLITGDCARRGT